MIYSKRFLGAVLGLALISACGGRDTSYDRDRGYTGSGTERMHRDDKGDSSTSPSPAGSGGTRGSGTTGSTGSGSTGTDSRSGATGSSAD